MYQGLETNLSAQVPQDNVDSGTQVSGHRTRLCLLLYWLRCKRTGNPGKLYWQYLVLDCYCWLTESEVFQMAGSAWSNVHEHRWCVGSRGEEDANLWHLLKTLSSDSPMKKQPFRDIILLEYNFSYTLTEHFFSRICWLL